jgi:hypothetical protein
MKPITEWLPELSQSQSDVADVIASVFWEIHHLENYGQDNRQNSLSPEDIFWKEYQGKLLKNMRSLCYFLVSPCDPITLNVKHRVERSLWNESWARMMYPGYSARYSWLKVRGDINLLGCHEVDCASPESKVLAEALGAGYRNRFVSTYCGYSPLFLLFALLRQNSDRKFMGVYFRKTLSRMKGWEVQLHAYKTGFLANLILENNNAS